MYACIISLKLRPEVKEHLKACDFKDQDSIDVIKGRLFQRLLLYFTKYGL